MDLETPGSSSLSAHNGHPAKAAEIFARKIHDTWGVGMVTAYCGGTGILLFLSEQDRSIYLSRGTALESVLTDRRLDKTIESVKPLLSQGLYGAAILSALRELDNYLIAGRPGWRERASDFFASYLVLVMISGACAIVAKAICDDRKQRRGYAKVASHLNELDRARATALQGRFQAKSCPICLEDFQVIEGSHCNETEKFTQNGSDGLPLRLLRCGHIFDETCWAEWVSSGHHGKVDKCPICQQNVGKPLRDEKLTDVRRAVTETTSASVSDQWRQQRLEEERNRAIRQYTYDRNFRLMQLGTRYPQFVRPQQIQTWSQVGYDGSLANDPSFVNSDPVRQAAAAASAGNNHFGSGGSGGTGFGGGSSGGGRSGQW